MLDKSRLHLIYKYAGESQSPINLLYFGTQTFLFLILLTTQLVIIIFTCTKSMLEIQTKVGKPTSGDIQYRPDIKVLYFILFYFFFIFEQ